MRALPSHYGHHHEPRHPHPQTTESSGACKLNPVVTVAGKGLSDSVLEEIRRALHDHELIKVKFAVGDRAAKQQIIADMCAAVSANWCSRLVTSRWYTRKIRKRNSA
jgi:RNA-binding protein YhbY